MDRGRFGGRGAGVWRRFVRSSCLQTESSGSGVGACADQPGAACRPGRRDRRQAQNRSLGRDAPAQGEQRRGPHAEVGTRVG